MLERGQYQIAEVAERIGPDRALAVVGDQEFHIAFAREHVEVVEPEPGHLLLQLRRRINRAQQLALRRFEGHFVAEFAARLARLLFRVRVVECVDALLLGDFVGHELCRGRAFDIQPVDLRLDRLRQRVVSARQLLVEKTLAAEFAEARHGRAVEAVGDALEPQRVVATDALAIDAGMRRKRASAQRQQSGQCRRYST